MPNAVFRYALLAMYVALLVVITPLLSIDYQARTIISVSELIVRHRPLSRYVAGCAAWALFLALLDDGWLSYLCWLSAHGIITFDADTHLRAHLAFLVLFCVLLLAMTTAAAASIALASTTLTFLALLALNLSCCDWWYGQQQNVLELVWLGALCWWVVDCK